MIYLGLAAIALVTAVLVLSDGSDSIGGVIEPDQLANLAWTGTILLLVVAGFWRSFTARLGANLQALLAWALIGLVVYYFYGYRKSHLGIVRAGGTAPGAASRHPWLLSGDRQCCGTAAAAIRCDAGRGQPGAGR